jgi:hypothetical protein
MPFIGNKPSAVPLTSADIADGIITTAKIADGNITSTKILDGTILNADINASAAITSGKLSGVPAETQSSFTTTISYNATLTATSANATVTKTAYYTKTGNIVVVSFPNITTTNTFSSNSVLVFSLSLPFTSNANNTTIGNVYGYNLKGRYNTDVIAATQGAYFISYIGGSSATAGVGTYATAGGSGYIYLVHSDGADLNLSCYYTT